MSTTRSLWARLRADAHRRSRRYGDLRDLVGELARQDFDRRHPGAVFGPVVVLIASYLEAENIGDVLKAVPERVGELAVSTLVVVDGGDDGTEEIVDSAGAFCARLPVNMGHGVALRLGYQLARAHGARYVVTVDADGQNDPSEIPRSNEKPHVPFRHSCCECQTAASSAAGVRLRILWKRRAQEYLASAIRLLP